MIVLLFVSNNVILLSAGLSVVNDLKGSPLCCAICMGDLHVNSIVARISVCRHYFHASCIRRHVGDR